MDLNATFLYDTFNIHYENAQKAYNEGRIEAAKRNFLLAAEAMFKLAKISDGKLKDARIGRAKRLAEAAENLNDRRPFSLAAEKGAPDNGKNGAPDGGGKKAPSEKSADDADKGREWQTAEIPDIRFDDIAGLDEVKKAITLRMIYPVKYPDKYAAYKKKAGGGVLLYGPPGTGKTMIAKAIACEVGARFYCVKPSDLISKWVGDSEKNINSLFDAAKNDPLAILFFDELEGLFGTRGKDTHNDKRVGEFLQQIDGFSGRSENVLLLGATNRPWDVDEAACRPGRFSQSIYIGLPDLPAREFMIRRAFKGVPLSAGVDLSNLAGLTEGYSGADLDELCDRAKELPLIHSIQTGEIADVTPDDFTEALSKVRPSVDQRSLALFTAFEKTR
ncbi:MAG: ATP-binding protein [Clostridiales bacterium]|jgi:SpoVK/Ycf46/Vps4 family AAA+-type ATPase|nr:ATP-binding protein [Clostridiales bacterium]